jgi:co-chaperonin GroES (HSP10)
MTEKRKNLIPLTPIGKSFLVEVVREEKTEGGIIMPKGVIERKADGFKGYLVLSTGPLCTEVQPGDTVMIKGHLFAEESKLTSYIVTVDNRQVELVQFNEYDVYLIRNDVDVVTEYTWQSNKMVDVASK